jgi:3-isopropylmalate/(R)-2-methylmalate dehydratase small subunit
MTVQPFTTLTAIAAPLLLPNVDTDVIIRADRIVVTERTDLGAFAFESLRFRSDGSKNPEFVLNRPPYDRAGILLAGENFGCGSSREKAVWALFDIGLRAVIAPSYGDIFYNNCFQNGMLPVTLPAATIDELAAEIAPDPAARRITVDLSAQQVTAPSGTIHPFTIDPMRREGLLAGLDDIGLTLRREADITAFQARDRKRRPWVYLR